MIQRKESGQERENLLDQGIHKIDEATLRIDKGYRKNGMYFFKSLR